jgi:hypothetical protein
MKMWYKKSVEGELQNNLAGKSPNLDVDLNSYIFPAIFDIEVRQGKRLNVWARA